MQLVMLYLWNNLLTGTVPFVLCSISESNWDLELCGNPLTLTIPSTFGNLMSIIFFSSWHVRFGAAVTVTET